MAKQTNISNRSAEIVDALARMKTHDPGLWNNSTNSGTAEPFDIFIEGAEATSHEVATHLGNSGILPSNATIGTPNTQGGLWRVPVVLTVEQCEAIFNDIAGAPANAIDEFYKH